MNSRNEKIDIIRGVAVFLVLWGHCIQYFLISDFDFYKNWTYKMIYSFHMPLFMIVSGYLFFYSVNKYNLYKLCISRMKSLGLPLIIWGCVYNLIIQLIYVLLRQQSFSIYQIFKAFFSSWFIWSVLVLSIMVAVIEKKSNGFYKKIISYVVGIVCIAFLPYSENNLFMFPFFLFGYYINKMGGEKGQFGRVRKYNYVL